MLRICALNESGSDRDSDGENVQVETREAQEANLLNLYTAALKNIAAGNIKSAKENLNEIVSSTVFQEEKDDTLARSLRYNVHKNLGECLLAEGDVETAQKELMLAADMDGGDVTLWFKIAGTAVKLNNLYMCRSALEQGLKCSPSHSPSILNLITATFKLGDFLACLGYCAMALEQDPCSEQAVLYKSKVYNEMPFLQDVYADHDFVPVHTEMETYYAERPQEPVREPILLSIKEQTLVCLAKGIWALSEHCDNTGSCLSPVDTANSVGDLEENMRRTEEMKIQVSVQNLVAEIIDIIEAEEEVQMFVQDMLDELLCNIFGTEPKKASEKISCQILDDIVRDVVDQSESRSSKKKCVVIDAKPRERKKPNIFEEIPDELIEKRRSSRKSRVQESVISSDASNDHVSIQTPQELLRTYLPPNLKLNKDKKFQRVRGDQDPVRVDSATKTLFSDEQVEAKWFDSEQEKREVGKFLEDSTGKTIWHLMRAFLDYLFRLDARLVWPRDLVLWSGRIYQSWRIHIADPLSLEDPEERLTQEFLRYYILGSECTIGHLMEEDIDTDDYIPEVLRTRLEQDLSELYNILPVLPVDLQLRVHSLRFHFYCLVRDHDEILYETSQLMKIYEDHPGIPIFHSLPQYRIASRKYLEEYSSGVSRSKELEELTQYYESKRYSEIVSLLLGSLESTCFTPNKETPRTPNKETQIDILIESLFHVGMYTKCMKWCAIALTSTMLDLTVEPDTEEPRKLARSDWTIVESYLTTLESCIANTKNQDFADSTCDTGSKLATVLIQILGLQIEDPSTSDSGYSLVLAWILLHKLIVWGESFMETDPAHSYPSNLMPGSLNLLCSAHDYLGQKSCCTSHNGQLLTYIVNTFLPILSKSKQLSYTDQLKTNLDQAVFCLFAHPSKKARVRHLADHNVSQIALTWHWARQLFKYMRPEKLPEHDDVKLLSISSDLESFLKRLVALLPTEIGIEKRRSTAQQFVQGKKKKLKLKGVAKMPSAVKDVFYLLADYAFKNSKDLDRAIDYYTLDVSVNPKRYDSWAALALAQASKMDKRLNSCKKLVPLKMLDYMKAVETCFKTCLKMNDGNSNLWIEFGNFSYNVHSYISRTLQNNSEGMNIELFERLETKKEELLKTAMENYKQTMRIFEADGIDENDVDERWLIYYMIGKIKEKSNSSLIESLKCYITSMDYLEKNGAILPRKVNYNSPQPLSLETLEIYYRVHASILKYLVKFENKETGIDLNTRQELYNVMQTVQLSKVYSTNAQEDKTSRFSRKRKLATPRPVEEPLDKIARSDESSTMIMRDVIEVVDTLIDDVDFHNDVTKYDFTKLIRLALSGLEDVAFHFFHHFKALYRLAHYYHTSTKSKNLVKVERLLLAGANDRNVLCPGLFFGRKPQQIFNDIWRYPIPEIDRPLSFASHCSKSLMLLLDVLRSLPDLNTLADIVLQLRKPPTEENKFVHESDRLEVGTMANTYLFNTIKSLAASVAVESETAKPSVILDIYKVYQKLQKQWLGKEKDVQVHLRDLFARIKGRTDKEKIAQEEISRFCNAEINKQKASTVQRNLAAIPAVAAAQQTPAVTTAATAVSHAAQSKLSQTDLLKSKESIVGYLNKISNFQETVAMSLPNITVQDVAGMCDLNYSEQPRQVNKLFQTLCKMELAQLKIVNFDSSKLAILSNFATKIGLVGSSVQVYVSRIRAILNGSSLSTHTKISPSTNGNSAGKVNLVRPPQFKQKMTPGQRNLKQLQMYLQQQQGDKSAVSAAKTIISSNLVNAATATTNSQLKAQVSNASPQPTQPIPSVGGQSLQPPQQASAIVKPGSTLTASSSIVSNTLKQLPAGITLTVERKTDSPKEASNNFGGRSFSSGSKVDNVTSKTTTGVPKPTQMVNSNISRSNSQSSIGGTAQQNNLSRSNSQINISRPAQQSNLSRPAQQSNLSRPNSQSNISRSNSQSHISRPNQQMNASRPNTISNPSRPNQQNNVARPSPQNNVSRPSPQNNVSRPSPQNNVSRPSPQNNVSRPSPQNTVTKHGMQSSGTKLAQPNNVSKPSTQNNYGRPNLQSPVGKSSHQTGYTRVAVPTSSSSSQNALAQFRAGLQKTLMMGGSSGAKKESLNQKKPQVLTAKPPQSNPAQKPSGGDPEIICLD